MTISGFLVIVYALTYTAFTVVIERDTDRFVFTAAQSRIELWSATAVLWTNYLLLIPAIIQQIIAHAPSAMLSIPFIFIAGMAIGNVVHIVSTTRQFDREAFPKD